MDPIPDRPDDNRSGVAQTVGANVHRLWSSRGTGYIISGVVIFIFFACLDRPAIVFLTQDVLDTGPAGFGLLLAAFSLGAVVGGLVMRFDFAAPGMRIFVAGITMIQQKVPRPPLAAPSEC